MKKGERGETFNFTTDMHCTQQCVIKVGCGNMLARNAGTRRVKSALKARCFCLSPSGKKFDVSDVYRRRASVTTGL